MTNKYFPILGLVLVIFLVIGNALLGAAAYIANDYGPALRGVSGVCVALGLGLYGKYIFPLNGQLKRPIPINTSRLGFGLFIIAAFAISGNIYIDYI